MIAEDYTFSEDDVPILQYGVACTVFPNDGFTTVINDKVLKIIESQSFNSSFKAQNAQVPTENSPKIVFDCNLLKYAYAFAKELRDLCPLSKLDGINPTRGSRSRLPNLHKTSLDYSDDLEYAVEELLCPGEEL